MTVTFCKSAARRFAIADVDVFARLLHGFDYRVKGYLTGIGEEVGKRYGVYRSHCRNGVALYARDLYEPCHGVASQAEMMLHCNFGRLLDLVEIHSEKLGKRRRRHRTRSAAFGLATAFCAAYRSVGFDDIADNACS